MCCGFAGRVFYNRFFQLCRSGERSASQSHSIKSFTSPLLWVIVLVLSVALSSRRASREKDFFNKSATYYWPVIFNNIIKLCTDDYSSFDLKYYSSAIKAEPGVGNKVSSCYC